MITALLQTCRSGNPASLRDTSYRNWIKNFSYLQSRQCRAAGLPCTFLSSAFRSSDTHIYFVKGHFPQLPFNVAHTQEEKSGREVVPCPPVSAPSPQQKTAASVCPLPPGQKTTAMTFLGTTRNIYSQYYIHQIH